ncbi:NAD-dependent epimerase/dehydratase family protein [Plantactinospora siamensis]|uniref:NAD-dependent epimerase/dehydratase family protein n=1 Tax=Plantactinospora siamensis TaxID=555372 RepID=A0ABV6P2S4_9ACTN
MHDAEKHRRDEVDVSTPSPAPSPGPTVLITGAAGGVARYLVPALRSAYTLRLTDRISAPDAIVGDLGDAAFARRVCAEVQTVVHLAADADPNQPWQRLREPNANAVANVLEGAAAAGVSRVVLASSLHAMGGHADAGETEVGEDAPAYPCCTYGALKVFAENLGRLYADQERLRVVCLRLGGVRDRPMARSWLPGWLSGPDLVRLVTAALTADVRYGSYHGVSANSARLWRWDRARAELGYHPTDDSARYAGQVPDDVPAESPAGIRPRHRLLHLT